MCYSPFGSCFLFEVLHARESKATLIECNLEILDLLVLLAAWTLRLLTIYQIEHPNSNVLDKLLIS